MAIIVEDGTGKTDSNAYITESELSNYAALRSIDLAAYDVAAREAAIIVCSVDFIDVNYNFKGDLIDDDQAMSLPTDQVSIDKNIKSAVCKGAILHLKKLLIIEPETVNPKGEIKSENKKLGPLETKTEYAEYSASISGRFDSIDRLLSQYLLGSGGMRLVKT
jgi:hypothetical protein